MGRILGVLAVCSVLGGVAALAAPWGKRVWSTGHRASPHKLAQIQACHLAEAVAQFGRHQGRDPISLEDLLMLAPGGDEPYLTDLPPDPWGHPYVLELGNGPRRVRSFGPDGIPGSDDDVEWPVGERPRSGRAAAASPSPRAAPERGPAPAAGVR